MQTFIKSYKNNFVIKLIEHVFLMEQINIPNVSLNIVYQLHYTK